MASPNRVMRRYNNPNARGFLIVVLEEESRNDKLGMITFRQIASATAGTRKTADREWDRLRAEFNAR